MAIGKKKGLGRCRCSHHDGGYTTTPAEAERSHFALALARYLSASARKSLMLVISVIELARETGRFPVGPAACSGKLPRRKRAWEGGFCRRGTSEEDRGAGLQEQDGWLPGGAGWRRGSATGHSTVGPPAFFPKRSRSRGRMRNICARDALAGGESLIHLALPRLVRARALGANPRVR
jgi:hypothetical protein